MPVPSAPVPTGPLPAITPNRRRLDNRFPVLAFNIQTHGRPYFEVLLATDSSLFDPAAAPRRTPSNFYAGRQDGGLLPSAAGETAYVVPAVVLKRFAEARPRPGEIFYTVAVYETPEGAPLLAQAPAVLAAAAPSVLLGGDFQASTMAAVLSVPVEKLQPIDGTPGTAREDDARSTYGQGAQALGDPALDDARGPISAPAAWSSEGDDDQAIDVAAAAWIQDPAAMSLEGESGMPAESPPDVAMQAAYYGELGDAEPLDGAVAGAQAGEDDDSADTYAYGAAGDPANERIAAEYGAGADQEEGYDEPFAADDGDVDEGYGAPQAYGAGGDDEPDAGPDAIAYDDGYDDVQAYGGAWSDAAESSFPTGAAEPAQLADVDESRVDEELGLGADWADPYDEGYSTYENGNGAAPTALAGPPPAAAAPLDIPAKVGILAKIGRKFEAPAGYGAINADTEFTNPNLPQYQRWHVGLSYGLIQFTQDSGMLGRLLAMMQDRDAVKFGQVFGPQAQELLRVTTAPGPGSRRAPGGRSARVQPVGGADLWQEPWLSRFRAAGAHPSFQAAQNEFAARAFVDPMLGFAAAFGMNTERALAMVCDRAVQQGPRGARRWLAGAIGPIQTDAQRQQALGALGQPGMREFQQASGLRADGEFGPATHAALVARLRQLGAASPIPIGTREQNMDAIVARADAEGVFWKARPRAIRTDPEFADTELTWTIPAAGGRH
jgi:hypothetical protein